jgi:hypothetical protein
MFDGSVNDESCFPIDRSKHKIAPASCNELFRDIGKKWQEDNERFFPLTNGHSLINSGFDYKLNSF